jgi:hypothetical protein
MKRGRIELPHPQVLTIDLRHGSPTRRQVHDIVDRFLVSVELERNYNIQGRAARVLDVSRATMCELAAELKAGGAATSESAGGRRSARRRAERPWGTLQTLQGRSARGALLLSWR